MGRIEELADRFERHIATRWQRTVSGAQRVIMVIYDKELERTLRARKDLFADAARRSGHAWRELDVTKTFAQWLAADEYRHAYFENPADLQLKLDAEFAELVSSKLRALLSDDTVDDNTVVGLYGVGALFGFARVSHILNQVERDVRGRLVVFFPGQYENNNYRLLDARDGWNYLAYPLTLHGVEAD